MRRNAHLDRALKHTAHAYSQCAFQPHPHSHPHSISPTFSLRRITRPNYTPVYHAYLSNPRTPHSTGCTQVRTTQVRITRDRRYRVYVHSEILGLEIYLGLLVLCWTLPTSPNVLQFRSLDWDKLVHSITLVYMLIRSNTLRIAYLL
jgi:hypothetical protein